MKQSLRFLCLFLFSCLFIIPCSSQPLWDLANKNKDNLRISTIFMASEVRNYLSTEDGIDKAIVWCKNTGVTRVFLETFRGGYTAERATLEKAKKMFEAAGIEASGCVTTTRAGKPSSGDGQLCCFTNEQTHKELKRIFEYTASIFDLIMIDDFFMTDCQCDECQKARQGKSMSDYRCELMEKVSRDYMINPARAVNPKVKIIIKYPLWYDFLHVRGYDVSRETALYDLIWTGTETRDYDYYTDEKGGEVQYHAYFMMRWLNGVGGAKNGGGWFDHIQTSANTYVEQARQTVLGDAKEMMLFNFGSSQQEIDNIEKLRREIPGLFELAGMVHNKPLKGILAPKPANSDAYTNFNATEPLSLREPDVYIYSFVGMLGLPLIPSNEIDTKAKTAFFSIQALKDPSFKDKFKKMISENKPVLITDSLAKQLGNLVQNKNVTILPVNGNTNSLLKLSREKLNEIRDKMLEPLGIKFDAPNKVGFYLIGDDLMVIENFNITNVSVNIDTKFPMNAKVVLTLPQERNVNPAFTGNSIKINRLPQRTLVVIKY